MSEKAKLDNLMENLFAKVLHPDLMDQLKQQIGRANDEYYQEQRSKVLNDKLTVLEPMLLAYAKHKKDNHPMASHWMKMIIKKINELYG